MTDNQMPPLIDWFLFFYLCSLLSSVAPTPTLATFLFACLSAELLNRMLDLRLPSFSSCPEHCHPSLRAMGKAHRLAGWEREHRGQFTSSPPLAHLSPRSGNFQCLCVTSCRSSDTASKRNEALQFPGIAVAGRAVFSAHSMPCVSSPKWL